MNFIISGPLPTRSHALAQTMTLMQARELDDPTRREGPECMAAVESQLSEGLVPLVAAMMVVRSPR